MKAFAAILLLAVLLALLAAAAYFLGRLVNAWDKKHRARPLDAAGR